MALLVPTILFLDAQASLAAGEERRPAGRDADRAARLARLRSQGLHQIFDTPQVLVRELGGRTISLARDAVLAEESYVVPSVRMAILSPITIGQPFRIRFPAGAQLIVRAGDETRARCLLPDPAPRDGEGRAYPDICLIDRDGDERHDVARFQPDDPRAQFRDMPIVPVSLRRLPSAEQPGLLAVVAERRLRVIRVERRRTTIIAESRLAPRGVAFSVPWSTRGDEQIRLPLVDGATARLAGLTLTARRGRSGGWDILTGGGFTNWLVLRDQDTLIEAGATTFRTQ